METVMLKKDSLQLGLLLGFLAPIFGLIIYYFVNFYFSGLSFMEFMNYLKQSKSLITGVSSLSLVANAVVFTVYINTHKDNTAKGIFVSTLIYGIAVLLVKLSG